MDVRIEVKRIEGIIDASTAIDVNKRKHLVKVVCDPKIVDSLNSSDIPYVGKMQRQAGYNGEKLEVWLKEVEKEEHITIAPTVPAVAPSAEEL